MVFMKTKNGPFWVRTPNCVVVADVVEQDRSGALSKERSVVVGDFVEQDRSGALSKERSVVVGDVVEQDRSGARAVVVVKR
jgi:hypothetical protein